MNHPLPPRRLALLAITILSLAPLAGADDLLKPAAGAPAAAAEAPTMSAEELKAVGERATKCAEKLGWRIGCQAWSFNNGSFFKAVDQTAALGLHYIEAFPDQVVDLDKSVKMNAGMSAETREAIKKKLSEANVHLGSFGVTGIPKDEAGARKMFEWAKEMGIETLVSEPEFDQFDLLDKLAQEYGIKVAIHNHPGPKNRYWNPDTELKVLAGRSPMLGSCSDVGHWQRSNVNPIEALQKLKGRIIESHFKDLNKLGEGAVDVPWGTGVGDAKGMMKEIHQQGAKITFLVEYENWKPTPPQRVQQIAQGIKYFGDVCDELSGAK
jgi:sugar phosphate isomerase/epimerase